MADVVRVVLAEDNYLMREGTRRLLQESGEVDVVAAVGSAEELLDAVRRLRPGAVLTDIRTPPGHHMEGIAAAHTIRASNPEVGVVVLSQHADAAYAFELFKEGTAGLAYLLKDRVGDSDELLRALREVVAGRSVVDPEVVDRLVSRRRRATNSPLNQLTPRELDVLAAMSDGLSTKAIARRLGVAVKTVENHKTRVFDKLGVRTQAHAVATAIGHGLLANEPVREGV